ncbi:hypothetical protein B7P43_G16809, partial [Cryptotermes secundus]
MKAGNEELASKLEEKLRENNKKLQSRVQKKLKESKEELQNHVEQKMKESNGQMREEIRREKTRSSTKKFQSETSKLSHQVRQLQGDTERELTTVQEKLQGISSEFEALLEEQSWSNEELTCELPSKILEVSSEVDLISNQVIHLASDIEIVKGDLVKCAEDLQKRQGESIAQLNKASETEKSGNKCKFD